MKSEPQPKQRWSKRQKILAVLAITLVLGLFGSSNDNNKPNTVAQTASSSTSVKAVEAQPLKPIPVISVDGANGQGDDLSLSSDSSQITIRIKASDVAPDSSNAVTVNGTPVARQGILLAAYPYIVTLQPGQNTFDLTAKNTTGTATKRLIINYDPNALTTSQRIDAEATCQEYAENRLMVKNINMSLVAEGKNADGTIFVKAKIADSRGLLHQEQPLGVMECTTSADGMTVVGYIIY